MADQKRTNHNQKLFIYGAVAIAVVIIVAIVLAAIGKQEPDASFFVSDDAKYVITIDNVSEQEESDETIDEEDGEEDTEQTTEELVASPIKTHLVYYYSGDTITDVKVYYEFKNHDEAQKTYDIAKDSDEYKELERVEVIGKFIVLTNKSEHFANIKASYIKEQIELMESLENATDEEGETTETETE